MDKIEALKVRFYTIIGRLQFEKDIVIDNKTLNIFESALSKCSSENETAGCILGAIRRYVAMLEEAGEAMLEEAGEAISQTSDGSSSAFEEDDGEIIQNYEQFRSEPDLDSSLSIETQWSNITFMVETEITGTSNVEHLTTDGINPSSPMDQPIAERAVATEPTGQYPDLHEAGDVIEMALTNTLIHNTPSVCEFELNTSRDKPSFFVIYSKVNEYDIGCEYTFKRKGECPRYECRTCRSLCDKDSKLRNSQEKAAAVTISINVIKEVKKSTHHPQCRVEFLGTALARSQKNAAIVFRSQYGGTCKQVYDKHTKVLVSSSDCVTAYDIAHGFQPFQQANSALKKSGKRKGAMIQSNVNVGKSDVIEKLSTRIVKSTPLDATDDYFLIGQDESAGVVVLGSRFLVERFFRSKKAMSDGTFKMAPKGYKQSYMMWFVAEGICKGESVERSKAMLSINFLLKGKSQATYASAFKILDEYRRRENIPEPSFEEYITDDEPAVRNAFAEQYPNTIFSLCFFHHNQNVVKTLAQHKLSNFIRKCKTDEQLWFYSKFKQILMIPLLPLNEIIPAFKSLKSSLLGYIESQFTNAFEIDQFTKCFETLEERYFSNEEKLKLICKHKKNMRCTNLIESTHCAFNKSDIIPKHGTVANFIEAMQTTDLQYRAEVIAFEEKGVAVLPKKKNRYVKQQAVISECNAKFDKKEIGVGEFLKKCSEAMIHEKYFKLIEAATKRFEKLEPNDDQDSDIDEHIMAIFATSESTHERVRKLCSKYFGEEWLN